MVVQLILPQFPQPFRVYLDKFFLIAETQELLHHVANLHVLQHWHGSRHKITTFFKLLAHACVRLVKLSQRHLDPIHDLLVL